MIQPTGTLSDIIPEARGPFEALLREMRDRGYAPKIGLLGAGRTCAQQNSIDAASTGATGCQSWHVLGRALDIELHPSTCDAYTEMGEYWEALGGFWGGQWRQFGDCGDAGHFHWPEREGQGSPPGCPAAEHQCASYREDYLRRAAEWKAPVSRWWQVLGGAAVAGAVIAWMRRR